MSLSRPSEIIILMKNSIWYLSSFQSIRPLQMDKRKMNENTTGANSGPTSSGLLCDPVVILKLQNFQMQQVHSLTGEQRDQITFRGQKTTQTLCWCVVFFSADVEASSGSAAPTQYLNMSHPCVICLSCKSFNLLYSSAVHVGLWIFFFLFELL